jgi:hypothetical protein
MSRAAESTSRKHTVGATDSVVSQMNVFGMLPVVPQVVDRLTITSIESWGEERQRRTIKVIVDNVLLLHKIGGYVFVGTSDGQLLLYEANQVNTGEGESFSAKLLQRKQLAHGKKVCTLGVVALMCEIVTFFFFFFFSQSVNRVTVLGNTGKLFSLCDGYVDIWACESLAKPTSVPSPPQSKNVVDLCVDTRAALTHARVAFQVKGKRVFVYEFTAGKFSLQREFALPELVRDWVWHGASLFVAYRSQYELLNTDSGTSTPLFSFGTQSPPCMRVLDGREEVFLANETLGFVVDLDGNVTRASLILASAPLGVAFHVPYVITLQSAGIQVHNFESGVCVQTLPVPPNTLQLLTQGQHALLSDGSSVLALLEAPVQQLVNDLLRLGRHNDAVLLFQQVSNEHHIDYKERLRAVREQAARVAWLNGAFADALTLFESAGADARRICALFDDSASSAAAAAATAVPSVGGGVAPAVDVPLEAMLKRRAAAGTSASGTAHATLSIDDLRKVAARAGVAQLRKLRPAADDALRAVLDTTLARLLVVSGEYDQLRELLFAGDARVASKDLEIWLIQRRQFAAAGLVYEAAGQLRKALDLWRTIGTTSDAQFRDAAGNDGVAHTQRLLSRVGDAELVLPYVDWLMKRDTHAGLVVLTATRDSANALPHAPVLAYLRRNVDSATTILYLEHVVNVEKSTDASMHTALALAYLDTMRATAPRDLRNDTPPAGLFGKSRQALLALLEQSQLYDAEELLGAVLAFVPAGVPASTVTTVSPLAEELVLLYARLRRHRDALRILVHQLRDDARAERYCAKHDDNDQGLLRSLLAQYVNDADANGRTVSARAKRLLERYATQLSAATALEELPESTPVAALERYLMRSLTHAAHKQRDAQIVAALAKVERGQVALQRANQQDGAVRIDRFRNCPVCHKPIADKVFARYPNGVTVHFACMADQHVDPTSGWRFGPAPAPSGKRK